MEKNIVNLSDMATRRPFFILFFFLEDPYMKTRNILDFLSESLRYSQFLSLSVIVYYVESMLPVSIMPNISFRVIKKPILWRLAHKLSQKSNSFVSVYNLLLKIKFEKYTL
jgi:hypothetical protein